MRPLEAFVPLLLPSWGFLATRRLGVTRVLLTLGPDGVVLDSDEAPPNAVRAGGQLEFTCLLPERDTKRNAWVVPLARGHVVGLYDHFF